LVGKYLNNYGDDVPQTYIPPGWAEWHASIEAVSEDTRYLINDNGVVTPMGFSDPEYPTDVFASRAESLIATTTSPYYLYVNTLTTHTEHASPVCDAHEGPVHRTTPATRHMGLADSFPLPQGPAFNEADLGDKPNWWNAEFPVMTEINIDCMTTVYRAGLEA